MGFSMCNAHLILGAASSITANYAGPAGPCARPLPQPGGQLCPHCPLPGLPRAGGKGRGLPIVLEQQPNVAGAPMIDGAWKLVPGFN